MEWFIKDAFQIGQWSRLRGWKIQVTQEKCSFKLKLKWLAWLCIGTSYVCMDFAWHPMKDCLFILICQMGVLLIVWEVCFIVACPWPPLPLSLSLSLYLKILINFYIEFPVVLHKNVVGVCFGSYNYLELLKILMIIHVNQITYFLVHF